MNDKCAKKEVHQKIVDNNTITHSLIDIKISSIRTVNQKKKQLYKDIKEEDRLYRNTDEIIDSTELKKFYKLAKECFINAGIEYDNSLEKSKETWLPCTYLSNNKNHKHKDIKVSNFGRVKIDGKITPQYDERLERGYLYIKELGTTLKVWTLVAETWLIKSQTECTLDVHHLSNNGYDQRPENLIWLTRCEHKCLHPNLPLCKNCEKPEYWNI